MVWTQQAVEIDKMILKCGKDKTITLAKINLQKNKVGALSLPGFKIYWHKGRMQIKRRD